MPLGGLCRLLQVATPTWQPCTGAGRAASACCLVCLLSTALAVCSVRTSCTRSPRYTRCPVSKQRMLEELQHGTTILEAAVATEPAWEGAGGSISRLQRQLAADVLVPTARVDLDLLEGIADAVL